MSGTALRSLGRNRPPRWLDANTALRNALAFLAYPGNHAGAQETPGKLSLPTMTNDWVKKAGRRAARKVNPIFIKSENVQGAAEVTPAGVWLVGE